MAANQVDIRITATGAEQAQRVLAGITKEGAQLGTITASGAQKAEAALGSMGRSVQNVSGLMAQAGVNTGIFGQAIGALGGPFGAAAAGAVALGLAIKSTTDFMTKNYEQMRQLMAVSGLEAEAADQLADTFDLLGFNVDALRGAMFKMSAEIDTGGKSFRALGINIRDAAGHLKTEGALFLEVRDRISALGSASQRNAALMDIFGRSGRELAAVFALSEAEFRKWLDTAGKMGPSAEESMRVTKEYTLASAALSKEWQGMVEVAGQRLLPVLTQLLGVMRDLIATKPGETGRSWSDWIGGLANALPPSIVGLALLTRQAKEAKSALADLGPSPGPSGPPREAPALQKGAVEEIEKFRKSLELLRGSQLDQPIIKINQQFKEFAEQWGPAAAAQMRPLVNEMIGLTRAAQAVPDQLAALKDRGKEVSDILGEAQLLLDLKNVDDELKALSITLGGNADNVQKDAHAWREEAAAADLAAEALKEIAPLAGALEAVFSIGGDRFTDQLIAANRELRALKATSDLDAESLRMFGVSFKNLDEATQASLLSLRGWNAEAASIKSDQAFKEALAGIQQQAALMGRDFDLLSANLNAFQRRILELQAIKNPTGEILTEIDQLKAKFADTKEILFWRDAVRDVFGSISSAISTSITGVILGTQTMAKAWENLWKSIVLSFVNSGIQRLLKGLTDWVLDFFSGTSGGGAGSSILGAIVAGAGALFSKLGGGGTSLGNPVGSSASALDQVTTAAKGTASALNVANSGVSNFSAGISAALSGLGVGAGIYGLTQGGSPASMAFSAGGTALSVYGLAQATSQLAYNAGLIGAALPQIGVLLAAGVQAIAPTLAASVGTALYTWLGSSGVTTALLGGGIGAAGATAATGTAGAASSILGSLTPFLDTLTALAGPLAIIGATVFYGLQGIASDAADATESWNEQIGAVKQAMDLSAKSAAILADAGTQMNQSHLVQTLDTLHSALLAIGDLDLAVGLNQALGDAASQGIAKGVPGMRASVSAAWLGALDAAFKQGIAAPTGSPGRALTAPWAGAVGMQSFDDMLAQSAGAGRDGFDKLTHLLEHISQSLDTSLYQVNATGVRMVDLGAVNALLDKEFLTTSLRNAVVDIGALFGIQAGQMGGIGAGEGNWRGTPGAGNMPSIAAIASAQAALEAAGFEPGKYGEALEAYLTSIDMNLVNNPAWKKFVDMLHRAGGTAGGLVAAITAAIGQNMTPMQFYGVAKAATDGLTAALKAQMTARASETDTDALKVIDDSIAAMTETVKAWSSLVTLYTGLPVEMAAIGGDLKTQTAASIDAWRVQMQSFTDAIVDSRKALDEAIASGNIASIASAAQAVHDQTIAQYNAVLKAVESIHQAIQGILEQAGVLVDMMTSVAQLDIRSNGSFATIGSLLGSLQDIAEHGGTAAIRLFAINKAIEAIIETLPTALEKFGSEGGAGAITGAVTGAARPFLAAQQGAIDQAQGAAQLALLKQQAQTINALASAVVAGIQQALSAALTAVRETADATIAGLTRERDAKLTAIDEEIGGIETEAARRHELHAQEVEAIQGVAKRYHDKAEAEIKAIETTAKAAHESRMAEIDAIRAAEDSAREYRAAEMDALSELINKAQEMESAVASMGKFIDALKKGPLGPGNPADKLSLAQQSFAQALTAFNRNPTAGGLTDLQDLSQTMLSLAEPILSKPSPAFQALSANTIKQLIAAQALARAQMTDSQVLKAQLGHLQAIDKATSVNVREQIAAIQAADEAAGKKADAMIEAIQKRDEKEQAQAAALIKGIEDLDKAEQAQAKTLIDKLNENKAQITLDFEKQTTAIETAFKAQVDAINKAAADEIDHVQKGTAAALQTNMAAQIPLLQAQFDAANAQLAEIGDTKVWQDATLAKLEDLRVLLAGAVPLASGTERIEKDGLAFLHRGEMVVPKDDADSIRSFEMGAGLPDATGQAVAEIIANWDTYSQQQQDDIIAAYNAADEATQQSAERAASYWQASAAQTARAATRPPDLSNTGPWAPGSGDPLRDPWMAHVTYRKDGSAIYEPGYGPGASPGSVVKFGTGPAPSPPPTAPPPPPTAPPPPPYIPPGPPWLNRPKANLVGGLDMANLGTYGGGSPEGGGGPITVVVKLDGKTIGEATLPTIQSDARSGKMRTIILETRAR